MACSTRKSCSFRVMIARTGKSDLYLMRRPMTVPHYEMSVIQDVDMRKRLNWS